MTRLRTVLVGIIPNPKLRLVLYFTSYRLLWLLRHPPRRGSILRFPETAIELLLVPEINCTVLDAVTDQIKAIKMDRVAISFTPRHVAYET